MAGKKAGTIASKNVEDQVFVIARVFDAPRELVWKAWTEPERMAKWWEPKGFTMLAIKMDLRPGGIYHYNCLAFDFSN